MNIVQALDDSLVFRGAIKDHSSWGAWHGFLKDLFGLPMDEVEAALFRDCTGRTTLPTAVFGAAWLVCGRRGGRSFALALIAVFLACFRDYRPHLAMGERVTAVIVAADRRQARVIFRYIHGIMEAVPALRALVEGETAEELRLETPVNVEVMTASSRTISGYAIPVALRGGGLLVRRGRDRCRCGHHRRPQARDEAVQRADHGGAAQPAPAGGVTTQGAPALLRTGPSAAIGEP